MMTAEEVLARKDRRMLTIEEGASVADALAIMDNHNVGAILVTREGAIVGIWTERDLMRNTLQAGFDPMTARVGDLMSRHLKAAPHTETVYELMDMFLGLRIRHLLIEKDGAYIGLLSSGDVMKAALHDKSEQLRSLNEMVSWDYYEEWRWSAGTAVA